MVVVAMVVVVVYGGGGHLALQHRSQHHLVEGVPCQGVKRHPCFLTGAASSLRQ